MKKAEKKSPLKEAPLRNPGQSLDEEIDVLWNDKTFIYFFYIICFFCMAMLDWLHWLTKTISHPTLSTIGFILVLCFCTFKIIQIKKQVNQLKLARDGEKIVGQFLDELREDGARILHDIKGKNFNVDHVIISEHGIFVVDTKTHRKPIKGDVRVRVDHDEVYVNNYLMERNPIKQCRALTKWIQDLLLESTGKQFPVRGVVVFPGWYVEPMTGKEDIWVLNNKALPTFIRNNAQKLAKEDVHLAFYHLSCYVRAIT